MQNEASSQPMRPAGQQVRLALPQCKPRPAARRSEMKDASQPIQTMEPAAVCSQACRGLRLLHASPCPPYETSGRRFRLVLYLRLGAPSRRLACPTTPTAAPLTPPSRRPCPPAGDVRHHLARGRCGRTRHPHCTARALRPPIINKRRKRPKSAQAPKKFFATPSRRRRRLPNRCHLGRDPGGRAVRGSLLVG